MATAEIRTQSQCDRTKQERYRALSDRLAKWLAEAADYDERVAPILTEELKSSRMTCQGSNDPGL